MTLSALFWRPVNYLLITPAFRSLSRHTSERALAAVLHDRPLRQKALVNLYSRIKAKKITVESLYDFGHTYVGPAIVGERAWKKSEHGTEYSPNIGKAIVPSNLFEAADILSRAARGEFPYWFNKIEGRIVCGRSDRGDAMRLFFHYNLPFFLGLSQSMNGNDWNDLVGMIKERNPDLGLVLRKIGKEIAIVEKELAKKLPWALTQAEVPRTPIAPYLPLAPKPSGPPPIPLSHRDHTDDSTVGEKRK